MSEKHNKHEDECVIPGPILPNGNRVCAHLKSDRTIDFGEMGSFSDGACIPDSALLLEPRDDAPVFDIIGSVEDLKRQALTRCSEQKDQNEQAGPHDGPAMINSKAYRQGWDAIFGKNSAAN